MSKVIDEIDERFGRGAIRFGACGFEQKWKTKAERRSKGYMNPNRQFLFGSATSSSRCVRMPQPRLSSAL